MKRIAVVLLGAAVFSGCVMVRVKEEQTAAQPTRLAPQAAVDCSKPVSGASIVVTPVASTPIADIPGKTLTSVRLDVPPGAKANPHQHAGLVYGYVLEGAVCSQITGDAELKPYRQGETFFEPPGVQHLSMTNPTDTPAKVLVTFIADTGATLTRPVQ